MPKHSADALWPVLIHSKGRAGQSKFISEMLRVDPPTLLIFVEPQDAERYRLFYPSARLAVIDKDDQGLQYVQEHERHYALTQGWKWFWVCDDDPKGFRRRDAGKSEKTNALDALLFTQKMAAPGVGMVGMARAATNFPGGPAVLEDKGVEWLRGVSREAAQAACFRLSMFVDVDFALQVLASGLKTRRTTHRDVALPPDGTAPGGLYSLYQKEGARAAAAQRLAEIWPEIVSCNGATVRIKWVKAFKEKGKKTDA